MNDAFENQLMVQHVASLQNVTLRVNQTNISKKITFKRYKVFRIAHDLRYNMHLV